MQKSINLYNAPGVPGETATLNPVVYTAEGYIAEGIVTAGNFVWQGTNANQAKSTGTGAPLGIIQSVLVYPNYDVTDEGSLELPDGANLSIARRGDFFVKTATAASRGQKVFATLADGSIQTGTAGSTIAGAVETIWVVETEGTADATIVISAWAAGA